MKVMVFFPVLLCIIILFTSSTNAAETTTQQCTSDTDCVDGDECTLNTCNNISGFCQSTVSCELCDKTTVQVNITTDKYGSETFYDIIEDDSGDGETGDVSAMQESSVVGVNLMEGGKDFDDSSTSYSDIKCFNPGKYIFTIYDSWGDGICCSSGDGKYTVIVDGEDIASGGKFGLYEKQTFVIAGSTVSPTDMPTPYPTHKAPTLYPTQTPPTLYPNQVKGAPTQYPTQKTPTMWPTNTPGDGGESIQRLRQ